MRENETGIPRNRKDSPTYWKRWTLSGKRRIGVILYLVVSIAFMIVPQNLDDVLNSDMNEDEYEIQYQEKKHTVYPYTSLQWLYVHRREFTGSPIYEFSPPLMFASGQPTTVIMTEKQSAQFGDVV